jgi:predicted transcriptional regulator of viral defense system
MNLSLLEKLRAATPNEVIDYCMLSYILRDYSAPRDVISNLLKHGVLIRVKKGLYVFGNNYRKQLICLELLANLIYGPSYVSREYALHYHGLIPESVAEITCMTMKRAKTFATPISNFSYITANTAAYNVGVIWQQISNDLGFFIATAEKSLADMIIAKQETISDMATFARVLQEDYRIDITSLQSLNIHILIRIARQYRKPIINLLVDTVSEIQNAR